MQPKHCEPASTIIKTLGGLTAVAKGVDSTPTTVHRWRLPSEKGGTGGFIPRKHHTRLIAMAESRGIEIPPSAFIDLGMLIAALSKQGIATPSPEAA